MATLAELRDLYTDDGLRNKITSAVTIAAYNLIKAGETPSDAEKAFAVAVMNNPDSVGEKVTKMVLAANASATVAQIVGASDSLIQSSVSEIIPTLVSVGI